MQTLRNILFFRYIFVLLFFTVLGYAYFNDHTMVKFCVVGIILSAILHITENKREKKSVFGSPIFEVGQIYKMNVADHSHVKSPYYVELIYVDAEKIITNIPGEHSAEIKKGSFEWGYHIPRMEYVGTKETHGHLILNQNNLAK